jgi:tetratricopeptide (TPR) repeat protein
MNLEAEVHQLKTEYAEAQQIHTAILCQTSVVLTPLDNAQALVNLAFLDIIMGASTDIISHNLETAITTFRKAQYSLGISLCVFSHADLLLREGDVAGARLEYIQLFATVQSKNDQLACYCLARLADPTNPVHGDTESTRWAVVFLAFTLCRSGRSLLTVHQALQCLGDVLAQQGVVDEALSILTIALEGFTWMDVHQSRAECMRTMGDMHLRRGEISRASALWKDAQPLFQRSLQRKAVSGIDARLADLEQHHEAKLERHSKLNMPDVLMQQALDFSAHVGGALETQAEDTGSQAIEA